MTELLTALIAITAALIALFLFNINYHRRDGYGRLFLLIFSGSFFAYFLLRALFYASGLVFHVIGRGAAMRGVQCLSYLLLVPLVAVAFIEVIKRRK